MFRSIKNKLIVLFLIAVLTPLLIMRLIAYPTAQTSIQETTISDLQSIVSKKASQVADWLNALKLNALQISQNPLVTSAVSLEKADINTILPFISHISCDAGFRAFIISNASGIVRLSTDNSMIGKNISDIEWFHSVIQGKTHISDNIPLVFSNSPEFKGWQAHLPAPYLSVPVKDGEKGIVGVLVLYIDLSLFKKEWQEIRYGDAYDVYVVNQNGVMIAESDFNEQSSGMRDFKKRSGFEKVVADPQTGRFTKSVFLGLNGKNGYDADGYTNYAGEKVFGSWLYIPELKWSIITEMSAGKISLAIHDLKNPLSKILSYLTIAGVIMAVAGIAFAFLIGRKIANPITALIKATRKMSAGDLSQHVVIKTQDEIRELADAFNVMAESVREKTTKLLEAKNFLKSILVSSTEHAIIALDLDGNIQAFNEGAKRMFVYTPEELIQKSGIQILYTNDDVESGMIRSILETTLNAGRYESEMQFLRKNGDVFTGYCTFTTRQSMDERPSGFVMITRDITRQKLLEQELHNYTIRLEKIAEERTRKLRVSEEKYRRLFESSKDVVFFCDTECQFVEINQAGVDLFGYEFKNDILKLNLIRNVFFNPGEGKMVKDMVCKNGFIKDHEVELKNKRGYRVPCLMTANLRRDERNNIVGYEGIIIDLTERKRIEQEKDILNNINKILASSLDLREVYKSLRAELNKVIDFDRMSITLLDEKRDEFIIFAVSKDYHASKLEEGLHYPKYGTLAGKVVENGEVYMVNDTSQGTFSTDPILLKEGIKSRLSYPLICKGEIIGSLNFGSRNVHNYSESHVDIVNKIAPQLAIAIDNTRLFDKIKESEGKYRNLVEDIEDVIFRLDKSGRYLFLNRALKNVTGYAPQEFYDNPSLAMEMIHKDDEHLVRDTIKKVLEGELKASKDLEYRIYRKNGEDLWVSQNTYPIKNKKGNVIGIEGIIRDITASKRIEEQIRRSERLASVGELAASIAHEIRNPLGAISNSVCMLKRDLILKDDDEKLLGMVVEETERLNNIITNFLTFAHPAAYHFVRSDITEIIDETLFLLEQDVRFNTEIKVNKVYANGIPRIYLDRDWIRKVFLNLLVNSIDAMPEGGKIFIRVRKAMGDARDEIEILIADTGMGIPSEIIKKIFEPFFTTKKSKGTGLGLSIVHRIIDNHGGVIDVKSKPTKWTAFTIRLPIKHKQLKTLSVQIS